MATMNLQRVRLKNPLPKGPLIRKGKKKIIRHRLHKGKRRTMPRSTVSIVDASLDINLFRPWFKDLSTWRAWLVFLRAVFGESMTPKQRKLYQRCTKRKNRPNSIVREAWLVVGRRGGKSLILSLTAIYIACFRDWTPYLSPGERATVIIMATDRKQARVIFRYIDGFINNIPLLRALKERQTTELFELKGQVAIEVQTASFRSVRGYTIVAALLDEIAFFRSDESNNPDSEILQALRPGMASVPGAMLLCASSPYARRGEMWKTYERYFGKENDDILVWQAPTWVMNPSIDPAFIEAEFDKDPLSAAAEYGAEFRTDVENFIRKEVVESCVDKGVYERPYNSQNRYVAFTDPSGGAADSFTLAIAHHEDGRRVLDLVREVKPPFSPNRVVREFCDVMKSYHIYEVMGDRYGGEWPKERFYENGVDYIVCTKSKSDLYLEMLPQLNSGTCDLIDNHHLVNQFVGLERKTSRQGKDSVDHGPGGHDDICNAVAGALVESTPPPETLFW